MCMLFVSFELCLLGGVLGAPAMPTVLGLLWVRCVPRMHRRLPVLLLWLKISSSLLQLIFRAHLRHGVDILLQDEDLAAILGTGQPLDQPGSQPSDSWSRCRVSFSVGLAWLEPHPLQGGLAIHVCTRRR